MYEAYKLFVKHPNFSELYNTLKYIKNKSSNPMSVHDQNILYHSNDTSMSFSFTANSQENMTFNSCIVTIFFSVIKQLQHETYMTDIINYLVDEYERINKKFEIIRRANDPGVIILKDNMARNLTLKKKVTILKERCFLLLGEKYAK